MKKYRIVWIILIITVFFIFGCASPPKTVTYNITENKRIYKEASVSFQILPRNGKISLTTFCYIVDVDGIKVPPPKEKTYWDPIILPTGRELNIRIIICFIGKYNNKSYGVLRGLYNNNKRMGIFKCPPLEAGKKYRLWFEPYGYSGGERNFQDDRIELGERGGGRLILTYDNVSFKDLRYRYRDGKPLYKQIYVQEIPPLW